MRASACAPLFASYSYRLRCGAPDTVTDAGPAGRHERYETQFRAVFVRNCVVDRTQRLRAQQPQQRQRQQQPRRQQPQQEPVEAAAAGGAAAAGSSGAAAGAGGGGDDVYYPVCCATCKQEVGVLDSDDVYHFFNVVFTAA